MKIKHVKISELKPFEKNPRDNSKESVEKVGESIKNHGFNQPIVVDENMRICVGHKRYFAAKKLKLQTVPCYVKRFSNEGEFIAYNLADNKTSEFSSWDVDILSDLMEEMKNLDSKLMSLTAFDDFEIESILEIGNNSDADNEFVEEQAYTPPPPSTDENGKDSDADVEQEDSSSSPVDKEEHKNFSDVKAVQLLFNNKEHQLFLECCKKIQDMKNISELNLSEALLLIVKELAKNS